MKRPKKKLPNGGTFRKKLDIENIRVIEEFIKKKSLDNCKLVNRQKKLVKKSSADGNWESLIKSNLTRENNIELTGGFFTEISLSSILSCFGGTIIYSFRPYNGNL